MSGHARIGRWGWFVGSLLGLSVAVAQAATDEPESSGFGWSAPAECPRREQVLERFSEVLGWGGVARAESVLGGGRVRGTIARAGRRWALYLEVNEIDGRRLRRLESEQCADLAHAAALALALLLDEAARTPAAPERGTREGAVGVDSTAASVSHEAVAPAGAAVPEGDAPPDDVTSSPARPSATLRWSAGVQGLLDTSTLAQPAFGASLDGVGRLGSFSLGAYGNWLPARRTAVAGTPRDVEFEHWALGLRPCVAVAGTRWVIDACASGELGRILARGLALDRARDASNPWLAAGPGVGLRWNRLGGAIAARADLLVPLLRERYIVNAAQLIHETPPVTLRLALGVDLNL